MRFRVLIIATFAATLSACTYHIGEQNLIIPRPGETVDSGPRDDGRWIVQPLEAKANDGRILHGAIFHKPSSIATVLYFGGNGFVLSKHADFVLAAYRDLPVDVAIFDHRGYGANPGSTSLAALYDDGVTIYDEIRGMNPDEVLFAHGHSLGSFIAGHVADERKLDGVILEATATTTEEWIKRMAGAKRFLVRIRIDPNLQGQGNLSVVEALDEPMLIVAGEDDTVTRPVMAQELYAVAAVSKQDKRLALVPGADHMHASHSKQFKSGVRWLILRSKEIADKTY